MFRLCNERYSGGGVGAKEGSNEGRTQGGRMKGWKNERRKVILEEGRTEGLLGEGRKKDTFSL